MKYILIALFTLALISCKQQPNKQSATMENDSPSFEEAHPKAQALMREEFYFSPIEETAPFGSDDGSDTYMNFAEWRKENADKNPELFLANQIEEWEYPMFDIRETSVGKIEEYMNANAIGSRCLQGIDAAILAVAFGQLYLEGTIDANMRNIASIAIKRQLLPEVLNKWQEDYQVERKLQLEKMLEVINKVE